jgi:hypothetical protein
MLASLLSAAVSWPLRCGAETVAKNEEARSRGGQQARDPTAHQGTALARAAPKRRFENMGVNFWKC